MSAPSSSSAPRAAAANDEEIFVCRQNCDWRFTSKFKRAAHERKCRLGIEPGRKPLRKAIDRKLAGKTEAENLADQMGLFALSTPQQQQQTQQQAQQQQQGGGAQQGGGENGTIEVQERMEEEDKMEVDEDEMEVDKDKSEGEDEMDVDEEGEGKAQDEQKVAREQVLAQVVVEVGAAGAPGGEQTVDVKVEDANSGSVFTFSLADDAWLVFE